MPPHRFHLARLLHGLVADLKEYMDDVIDAFEMVEGAGRSAVLAQHSVGEAEPDTERASRPTTPKSGSAEPGRWDQAAEISALRNELNRLREILDGGDKPSRSGAPAS